MSDPAYEAARRLRREEPETYLSWSDEGVTLMCERDECRVPGPCPDGSCWYYIDLPFKLTPEMAVAARNAHVRTHNRPAVTDGPSEMTTARALNDMWKPVVPGVGPAPGPG